MPRTFSAAAAVLLAGSPDAAGALHVIGSALSAFARGDDDAARLELGLAGRLLEAAKLDALARFLPAPLAGWSREDVDEVTRPDVTPGGRMVAAAAYHKDGVELTVTLVADSPATGGMVAMLSGIAALQGGRPLCIRGTEFCQNGQDLQATLGGRVTVAVGGDAAISDKAAFVAAMDLTGLGAFAVMGRSAAA